ncbi:MAG: hypothetical protein ACRD8W_23420, partial [Nitrososphaeraceae archaeon]
FLACFFFHDLESVDPVNVLVAFTTHILLIGVFAKISNIVFDTAPSTDFLHQVMWLPILCELQIKV